MPFRLLVNEKFLIEFEVCRGSCIEATWDSRIWEADITSIKLVETLEKKDKAKSAINAFQKCFGDIDVRTTVDYSSSTGYKEVITISNSSTKWMNRSHNISAKFSEVELIADFEDANLKKFGVELKAGMRIYDFTQADNLFVFKLKPEDKTYYSVQYTPESRYSKTFYNPILKEGEVLLFNNIYQIIAEHEIGELVGIAPHGIYSQVNVSNDSKLIEKGTIIYDVKELNSKGGTILFKLDPNSNEYYFSNSKNKYKFA